MNSALLQSQLREVEKSGAELSGQQPSRPWPEGLPVAVSTPEVLGRIRAAVGDRAVAVLSISVSNRASSLATQGRLIVDLDLRGTYAAIKEAVAEMLSRESGYALVQAMSYRRRGGVGDLDSHVQLIWLTRPLLQQ